MAKPGRVRKRTTRASAAADRSHPGFVVERDGPVLRVWLARPERRNALATDTLDALAQLYTGLQRDFETRVVVLGGRGASFCAGADRKQPPGAERMAAASGAS